MLTETKSSEYELLNETLDDAEELVESQFDDALYEKERQHFRSPNKIYNEYCSFRNLDDAASSRRGRQSICWQDVIRSFSYLTVQNLFNYQKID